MQSQYHIGIMSGTSADGIDAALVDFSEAAPRLVKSHFLPFPADTKQRISDLFTPDDNEIDRMGELDVELGRLYEQAARTLLSSANINSNQIAAVGLHGQTIRHRPTATNPFTLQIGNPYFISHLLGITAVNDFRRADMALGGQGAPLAPLFHKALFHSSDTNRVIVNIGGIANITYLETDGAVSGFDTGPGNGLMDNWIEKHLGKPFDEDGQWAASGKAIDDLLQNWLEDSYYGETPPKSTGKEYFTLEAVGLDQDGSYDAADIQRTLCELTAVSITKAIADHCPAAEEIYICGGGAFNSLLIERISSLSGLPTGTTSSLGVAPDWVEAVGFAWLAKECLAGNALATMPITGASTPCILGAIHPAAS